MSVKEAPLHAVTFDCWSTLLHEVDSAVPHGRRVEAVLEVASARALRPDRAQARAALDESWMRHYGVWTEGRACGAREIATWTLETLAGDGAEADSEAVDELTARFAAIVQPQDVRALPGAVHTLSTLAAAGVRLALICDTGFTPGVRVRGLLDAHGLLANLEHQVFSDEAGAPKPHASLFHAALEALDASPQHAVHVGDLRRTDVAGARGVGMRTARIRHHHDDHESEHAEADWVADTYDDLLSWLGITLR